MESHQDREEKVLLRERIVKCEEKMRLLADALEARNEQMKNLVNMYNDLQDQYNMAQEAANSAAELLNERDGIIEQYSQLIAKLQNEKLAQSKNNAQEAANLRDGLTNERRHFIETLNRLSQAKAPAEEAFKEMEELLDRKGKEYADLMGKFDDLTSKFAVLNESNENREADLQKAMREKCELEHDNRQLKQQLADAKSGRRELAEIDRLNKLVEETRQKSYDVVRSKKQLKAKLQKCITEHQKQQQANTEQEETVRMLEDKILDMEARVREITAKNDDLRAKTTEAVKSELKKSKKLAQMEEKYKNMEEQLLILQEQNRKLSAQKAKDASARVKEMRSDDQFKVKINAYKKRMQEEMAKRVGAEEVIYSQKEEIFNLKKENALLKDQVSDNRSADVEPLVKLLQELRLEAIDIDDEYRQLIESIPESKPIMQEEVPKGICESAAASVARILARTSQTEIENRELRTLCNRFARFASIYHKIVEVIHHYPVLSADDVGQEEPYGNWVLPVDVEHLQRTVVKLHEILSKRR